MDDLELTPAYIGRCRRCNTVIGATVDDQTHNDHVADFLYELTLGGFIIERTTVGEARALFGRCTCAPATAEAETGGEA